MSDFYNPKRKRNLYDPKSDKPYRLSRSKIDLFINCPHCFYIDRRLGVGLPPGFPFNLNSAVDELLKKEFDYYRELGKPHPLMEAADINAIPFQHEKIDDWRNALHGGIQYLYTDLNLLVTGGIDDVWINEKDELIIVDYKATSKKTEVSLDADWQIGYKRQLEIYQWLFRKNEFKVSDTGYFVYCNGRTDLDRFDMKLEFTVKLLPYIGSTTWVEQTIKDAHACLCSDEVPPKGAECDFCRYTEALGSLPTAIR